MTALVGDNRIVHGLWVGGRLTELERLCIRSFCANGHEFHLYHYDELQNLPKAAGLRLLNAEGILPRSAIFTYRKQKSLAGFADRFRWELMRQNGGWYADMDMVCLRPLNFAEPVVFGYESKDIVNSALIKFPRGHFMATALADACANINKFVPWDTPGRKLTKIKRILAFRHAHKYIRWGETGGPKAMSKAVKHFGLERCAFPSHSLYVAYHPLAEHFFDDSLHRWGLLDGMLAATYVIHVANSGLAKRQINKDGTFPPTSPFEVLKRRYPEPQ